MGLFNNRGAAYIDGSYESNTYYDYELLNKYIINDRGGTDDLTLVCNVTDIRTFFDINVDETLGKDLYFTDTSGLYSLLQGNTPDNYLKIANAFGTGKMETVTVEDVNDFQLNYKRLTKLSDTNSLAAEVAGWLSENNFSSVEEAVNSGMSTELCNSLSYVYENHEWSHEWQLV